LTEDFFHAHLQNYLASQPSFKKSPVVGSYFAATTLFVKEGCGFA
jgi:hypothetical protein